MNFIEAIKTMKKQYKVRRACWEENQYHQYLIEKDDLITWQNGHKYEGNGRAFLANDWEIVDEKKTLSDRMRPDGYDMFQEPVIPVKYVQGSIQEFIDWVITFQMSDNGIAVEKRAKEIFGKQLLKFR